jgi:hypothetical protein
VSEIQEVSCLAGSKVVSYSVDCLEVNMEVFYSAGSKVVFYLAVSCLVDYPLEVCKGYTVM